MGNQVILKDTPITTDAGLVQAIVENWNHNTITRPFILIKVTVKDGFVTLTGNVIFWAEY
ncbi:hypothetical protein Poly59_26620 [Rubripirellula reticaptiva]|uniref:Uncharacterized protein n=1 Tax=Rubripirellula reticaptiva TaxID=2528013 RepID=A0A5C6F4T3_9BACT|nr:hypothetical protein Poly59_26620 [Rubripirellula reticaptiva]